MALSSQPVSPIRLMPMSQLVEAVDRDDDWTGMTDEVSRRRRQNRLNVRAYRRRRKASKLQAHDAALSESAPQDAKSEPVVPCWVEGQQTVSLLPTSVARRLHTETRPLIKPHKLDLIFPISSDHLITLLQFNVLRAGMVNRQLLAPLHSPSLTDCATSPPGVLPGLPSPDALPPSLHPTALQLTVPHEGWVDIVPHPVWRDNLILTAGTYDEDELWSDTIGGLFEGFPHSEVEHRGVIVWSPPWHVSGWELSEGFLRKWGWTFTGCEDVLEATNKWRRKRGEEPLVFKLPIGRPLS